MSDRKPENPSFAKRVRQMRVTARHRGKSVPDEDVLWTLFSDLEDMACPECSSEMDMFGLGRHTLTLQHDRSGGFRLLCRSCNTRHASYDGDSFYTRDESVRRCRCCEQTKTTDDFYPDRRSGVVVQLKSICKDCTRLKRRAWQQANRDYYNRRQREGRARRKAAMLAEREERS